MKTVRCSYNELYNKWVVVITTRYEFGSESKHYYFGLHAAAVWFANQQQQ